MGKPFNSELEKISGTIQWADQQDVSDIAAYLFNEERGTSLVSIGSGGSLSACHFVAQLCQQRNGVLSQSMTPLQLMYSGREIIRSNKLLFLSASGKNKDILNAIKYGVKYNEKGMMSLTLRKENPTEKYLSAYLKVHRWCEDIPSGKDGFLATNSLVGTFAILSRCFDGKPLSDAIMPNEGYRSNKEINLADIQDFLVLYGAAGESVALDIESKLTEAALGAALLSDYRNFGHGRHHWFSKRKEHSCIIALVTPVERDLAEKTLANMPNDVPVIYIESSLDNPRATVDMLIKSFHFVQDLGEARAIDPGMPGVPSYGRLLYNLNYFKLTERLLPSESTLDLAVRRKLGPSDFYAAQLVNYYRDNCKSFVARVNRRRYSNIVFDYDGTLSEPDHDNRYKKCLSDGIKKALEGLLKDGARILVATGRGKSVGDVFCNSIDKAYWSQIRIGYYNGACICALGEAEQCKEWKQHPLEKELKLFSEELKKRLPEDCVKYTLSERFQQISIEDVSSTSDSDLLYIVCREIILDLKLSHIHVWRSTHSMDVLVYEKATKRNIVEDAAHTLCIGDYGSVEGNDYELLNHPASLSVDKVSRNPTTCWNIAPSGIKGCEATLYYLSRLSVNDGVIKCKFNL